MSRLGRRAALFTAATLMGCANAPSARLVEQRLDGPKPPQAILRCEVAGLKPPVHIAWKLPNEVAQVGNRVSDDEPALLVQLPSSGGWASCTATGADSVSVKATRALQPPLLAAAPAKIKRGDKVTIRGSGFGPARNPDDAVWLVPAWGPARALDHTCKGADWNDAAITACVPATLDLDKAQLRVQAGGELALAPAPLTVTR